MFKKKIVLILFHVSAEKTQAWMFILIFMQDKDLAQVVRCRKLVTKQVFGPIRLNRFLIYLTFSQLTKQQTCS